MLSVYKNVLRTEHSTQQKNTKIYKYFFKELDMIDLFMRYWAVINVSVQCSSHLLSQCLLDYT